jgi:hypothetical protein
MPISIIRRAGVALALTATLFSPLSAIAASPVDAPAAAVAQQADRAGVIRSTERYIAAIKAKDGLTAAKYIDTKGLKWYGDSAKLAISANRTQWEKLKFAQRLVVVRLRHELNRADLRKLDGPKTLAFGVERGWIDQESVNNLKIANVRVTGKTAKASIESAPSQYILNYVKEGDTWKLAILDLINLTNPVFENTAKESGMDPLEFMTFVIESTSTRKVDPAIYDGPLDEIQAEPAAQDTTEAADDKTQTLSSADEAIALTVPGNWRTLKLNNDADIQAGNSSSEQFGLVISDEISTFEDFAAFDEVAVGAVRDNLNDKSTGAGRVFKVNGLNARQYTLSGRVSGIDISYLYTTIEGKKGFYQILLWTRNSRFKDAQRSFETITESFQEN